MNMKRMMITAAIAAILGVTGFVPSVEAAVTVTNVVCRQHYPWNGLVDIDYEIQSDDAEAKYFVYPKGEDRRLGAPIIMHTLSGDGATNAVGVGTHRMIWDAKADMPNFSTPDFAVTLQAISQGAQYLVVDLSGGTNAFTYPVHYSTTPPDVTTDKCRTTELWLRLILPGTFMMGSPAEEKGHEAHEQQHLVTLTRPYYIGIFELTQAQWMLVSAITNSIKFTGECRPVDYVSYNTIRGASLGSRWPKTDEVDAESFMGIMRKKTGLKFDLSTEAQWEYACRAGTTTPYNNGQDGLGQYYYDAWQEQGNHVLDNLGRYYCNHNDGRDSYQEHTKVGLYTPNAWGIYDMHGNVREWCRDGYRTLPSVAETDPRGAEAPTVRVRRGGDWDSGAKANRSATRVSAKTTDPYYQSDTKFGFRVVCLPVE